MDTEPIEPDREAAVKLPALRYAAPDTLADACALLEADEDAKIIAGGQSLMPLLAIRLAAPSVLVDLRRVPGLDHIEETGEYLRFGAMVTHQQIVTSPLVQRRLPFLVTAGRHIAHVQIRSRGTLGGAIAHGDAAGEWPLALLTLAGMVEVESVRGRRTIHADDLFAGPYMTALAADEILTDVWFPAQATGTAFQEAARRAGDYGLAVVGVNLGFDGDVCTAARVVVGAAVGVVQRAARAEDALVGRVVDAEAARAAGAEAASSVNIISDIHGSRAYRSRLVAHLVERAVREAGERR